MRMGRRGVADGGAWPTERGNGRAREREGTTGRAAIGRAATGRGEVDEGGEVDEDEGRVDGDRRDGNSGSSGKTE